MSGLVIGLVGALSFGLLTGLAIGLNFGVLLGLTGTRYVALLVCTRKWLTSEPLPWRLGRFLDWCYQAGLIRQAGIAYQFRHRELQHYLAHT
ncbi:hypothetical protein ACQPW3_23285 [Actinosynnema sp. CA-248983]